MFYITVDEDIQLHLLQEHHYPILFKLIDGNRDYLREHLGAVDKTPEDVRARCLRAKEHFAKRGTLITLIMYQGQAVGMINVYQRTSELVLGAEIGYWLAEEFVGKGIITRSAQALTSYAFAHMAVNRVFMGITPQNPRSCAIPERLGFTLEGTIRQNEKLNDEWVDHRIYTMLKDDWQHPQDPPILSFPIRDNLELRLVEEHHAQAIFDTCDQNREHIGEWLVWIDDTETVNDTLGFIELSLKQYGDNDGFQAGIWQNNQLVGMIGYLYWNTDTKYTEIGYWLAEHATGQGIITQCTRALVEYAFDTLNLNRVMIRCAVANEKSGNVAIRLGFTHEGILRDSIKLRSGLTDTHIYSILAREWQTQE